MSWPIIFNVLIAVFGLFAAWTRCVHEKPQAESIVYRIPYAGPLLSRIRWNGWTFIVLIVNLTVINVYLAEKAQNQLDARLVELRQATRDIQNVSHDQARSLSRSIDRLESVKNGVQPYFQAIERTQCDRR